jgi:hypothetical protein
MIKLIFVRSLTFLLAPWKVAEMEPNTLFRYQYLAGNPVSGGWQSWNTPTGAFGILHFG